MPSMIAEFTQSNAALLIAVVALLISLRANWIAHKAHQLNIEVTATNDRRVFAEKHRELLNELDTQYTKMATLALITSRKILLFKEHPLLHDEHAEEFDRLKSNLRGVEKMRSNYAERRNTAEQLTNPTTDAAEIDNMLSKVRQLTIHIDKDIRHEESDYEHLRSKALTLSSR